MLGIARFKVIDILRSDGRQPSLVADPAVGAATTFDRPVEAGAVTSIGERMLVAEALAGLSERAREMVRLALTRTSPTPRSPSAPASPWGP